MPIVDWDKTHKTYAVNKDDFQRNPIGMVNQQTTSYASDLGTQIKKPQPTKPATQPKPSGTGSGSGGTSSIIPDYKASLDDLYNKVMGYGNYTPGAAYAPSTYTPGTYSPSVYSRTVDTSGTEAMLDAALGDINNYGDFKYDLNADMLYQQALDNYVMQGQQAMVDATANAAALTGGYGNSYAAGVGNQAFQAHLTQANNMIPQFQQMALNRWQTGYDRLLSDYNAISQQLANLLDIENMNYNIWNANESNAANAFAMNEANRYNAWASNEQNAFNAWQQNEQNAYNQWLAGYNQINDQYNLAKDYYATLEALQQASGGSGGSSSSGNKTSSSTSTNKAPTVNKAQQNLANAYNNILTNMNKPIENPLSEQAYLDYLEALRKK